ncbi:uncharacterized protein YpiB (UPF0302 family) [Gracilibacillus halotolerans]|uniref:Uncharacterized protein YpiB (UPF0302 family) n=1 Tax=Gracilibacillus halotolerans TaxID=74386 RepID=A0A841RJ27_9BACI|nr:IDEAL domain-containing protein [Gracilibacillus halotolerans]MBB6512681.1 uncharacterized protein YpiB (UPF0302 family) [Gracilibacillus halotolerans]
MKKEKTIYRLRNFVYNFHPVIHARKEITFEMKLASKLVLDELKYEWNKARLQQLIDDALDKKDKEAFIQLSKIYVTYINDSK